MLGIAAVAGVVWYDAQLTASASTVMLAFTPPPPAPPLARGGNQNTGNKNTATQVSQQSLTPPAIEPDKVTPPSELPPVLPNGGEVGENSLGIGDPHGSSAGVPGGVLGGVPNGNGNSEAPPPPPPTLIPEEAKPIPAVVRKSEGVLRGMATNRSIPEYPALAKMSHIGGDVVVEIVISEEGKVVSARCINGHALLQSAALNAAREFRFRPTLLNNTPVKVTGILTFRFTLNS